MNIRQRKLFVEVNWLTGRRFGVLEQHPEDLQKRLEEKGIPNEIIDETIVCLLEQRANPKRFPNVILCLNDNDEEISFLDFFKNCRKRR